MGNKEEGNPKTEVEVYLGWTGPVDIDPTAR